MKSVYRITIRDLKPEYKRGLHFTIITTTQRGLHFTIITLQFIIIKRLTSKLRLIKQPFSRNNIKCNILGEIRLGVLY